MQLKSLLDNTTDTGKSVAAHYLQYNRLKLIARPVCQQVGIAQVSPRMAGVFIPDPPPGDQVYMNVRKRYSLETMNRGNSPEHLSRSISVKINADVNRRAKTPVNNLEAISNFT